MRQVKVYGRVADENSDDGGPYVVIEQDDQAESPADEAVPVNVLDAIRAHIVEELAEYADPPIANAAAVSYLAAAYRDLSGDLGYALGPPLEAHTATLAGSAIDERLIAHASRFLSELPGLRDATSWADQLHAELTEIARGDR